MPASRVRIFPNPTDNMIYVASPYTLSLSLYNVAGKCLGHYPATKHINLASFASGLYLLHICDAAGQLLKVEKIIRAGN